MYSNSTAREGGDPMEIEDYMTAWSEAQGLLEQYKAGEADWDDVKEAWKKVQFRIWMNDLNDGNGYVQEEKVVWPMFDGEAPEGVVGMSDFRTHLVNAGAMQNVTMLEGNAYGQGFGVNHDKGGKIYYYDNLIGGTTYQRVGGVEDILAGASTTMIKNKGNEISGYLPYSGLEDLLSGHVNVLDEFKTLLLNCEINKVFVDLTSNSMRLWIYGRLQ